MIENFIEQFTYLGIFLVLFAAGVGMPLPEEVPVIASAVLAHEGVVRWWLVLPVCIAGVLSGDQTKRGGLGVCSVVLKPQYALSSPVLMSRIWITALPRLAVTSEPRISVIQKAIWVLSGDQLSSPTDTPLMRSAP